MLSHSDVIAAFGGIRPLAKAIGVDPKRACHWHQRGIPAKYWHRVVEIGAVSDPPMPPFTAADLERTKPDTSRIAELRA